MTGYIVFAHGSSIESANQEVRAAAADMARKGGLDAVEAAFLGGGTPDLVGAVGNLARRGAKSVIVIPYFLTMGLHLQRDLPELVDNARRAHPGIGIELTPPLDGHPALIDVLLDRARESECRRG